MNYELRITDDGSSTFFSNEFGETFHSCYGAKEECLLKFIEPTQLSQKAQQPTLQLLDICYGLGYNTATALETIWSINPHCRVKLIALELDPDVPKAALAHHLLDDWNAPIPQLLAQLATDYSVQSPYLQAKLLIGDGRKTIQSIVELGDRLRRGAANRADAIFLDPFSPPHCPQLWTIEFLQLVARCCKPTVRLATYSCAASVRVALQQAGFSIGGTPPIKRKTPGTVASFTLHSLPSLSIQEQEHLQTRAAVPYRDPQLGDTASTILHRRQIEQQGSSLEPTSHWKKRWHSH